MESEGEEGERREEVFDNLSGTNVLIRLALLYFGSWERYLR